MLSVKRKTIFDKENKRAGKCVSLKVPQVNEVIHVAHWPHLDIVISKLFCLLQTPRVSFLLF